MLLDPMEYDEGWSDGFSLSNMKPNDLKAPSAFGACRVPAKGQFALRDKVYQARCSKGRRSIGQGWFRGLGASNR